MAGTDGTAITNTLASETASNYEVCQRTGFRLPAGKLEREWTGLYVRPDSIESRHPQELLRMRAHEKPHDPGNPEPDDRYVEDVYPSGVAVTDL
jgi:hypothetical protein